VDVPSPSTYRFGRQATAAISTVSWISTSAAPSVRAFATVGGHHPAAYLH